MENSEYNYERVNNKNCENFIINLLKLMRPKQWVKNFFVFGALIFSYSFLNLNKDKSALLAFVLFCLISSSVYIMNDILDVEKDRVHPKKRFRPIASGAISIKQSIISLVLILSVSMVSAFFYKQGVIYYFNAIFYK